MNQADYGEIRDTGNSFLLILFFLISAVPKRSLYVFSTSRLRRFLKTDLKWSNCSISEQSTHSQQSVYHREFISEFHDCNHVCLSGLLRALLILLSFVTRTNVNEFIANLAKCTLPFLRYLFSALVPIGQVSFDILGLTLAILSSFNSGLYWLVYRTFLMKCSILRLVSPIMTDGVTVPVFTSLINILSIFALTVQMVSRIILIESHLFCKTSFCIRGTLKPQNLSSNPSRPPGSAWSFSFYF